MAVDPTINLSAQDRQGTFWAYEICDPVEADRYGYEIDGVLVTDFVTPAWFGFQNAAGKLDFQSQAQQAFTVLPGGYAQKFEGNGWQQVNGAEAQMRRTGHVKNPAPGSRRERRVRRATSGDWRKSDPASIRNAIRAKRYNM
jgi:hypothetical protein